jgi:hypothetical protein
MPEAEISIFARFLSERFWPIFIWMAAQASKI